MKTKRNKRASRSALVVCLLFVELSNIGSGEAAEIWSSVSYPREKLGPDNWRYYRGPHYSETSQMSVLVSRVWNAKYHLDIPRPCTYWTVELPPAFSSFSLSFTKHWSNETNGSSGRQTVPLVCFGYHGPPLVVQPRNSLLEAAITAGTGQNASATGECAWFSENMVINVTNMEVVSGTFYVGIFSDAKPTRTQSKMIPRGNIYTFGLGIQVFRCGSQALGGPECNLRIGALPSSVSLRSLHSKNTQLYDDQHVLSSRPSSNDFEKEIDHYLGEHRSVDSTHLEHSPYDMSDLTMQPRAANGKSLIDARKQQQHADCSGESIPTEQVWISSSQQCVGLDDKQFFSLHIVDFVQELEIKYDCISNISHGISKCEEFETMVKEERIPLLHLRHGALPGKHTSDFEGEPSTGTITVAQPRRGWWYLAVFGPNIDKLCLTLTWRVRACGQGFTGIDCQWQVLLLERILKAENESPFDSFYLPASNSENQDSEWFSPISLSNASSSSATLEQWAFAIVTVANGAAGAVLSIDLETSSSVHAELYARHEACPTTSEWDFQITREVTQKVPKNQYDEHGLGKGEDGSQILKTSKYKTLSLHIVYPMEGDWCLGLRYVPLESNLQDTVVEHSPNLNGVIMDKPTTNWISRWKSYFICSKGKLSFLTKAFLHKETGTICEESSKNGVNLYDTESSAMELRVTLHGCKNDCSGHGSCQTVFEASRLHFISYCFCDVAHGDFDCSTVLLGPWKNLRQQFFLIFSNAAAILPSIWAVRHKAFSEWIAFTLSGIASAIYHSCDAGGWCAMSYSTLQFLDFWLSFVVVIMTCLHMAGFAGPMKAMLHICCAVLTAAVAKENATSGWSILVVVLIGSTILLLGWGLETQKLSSVLSWGSLNQSYSSWLQLSQRLAQTFYIQLRDRFRWGYLCVGLALLVSSLLSNSMETPETYWLLHSGWHVSIYTSAFIFLYSIRDVQLPSTRRADAQCGDATGYRSVDQREDEGLPESHDALLLELDSLPESRPH